MDPGESYTEKFIVRETEPTYWQVLLEVDPDDYVNEACEIDNTFEYTSDVFGWYEKPTKENFPWPTETTRLINSVLCEPRPVPGQIAEGTQYPYIHAGTDFGGADGEKIVSMSSARIISTNENNALASDMFKYFHLYNKNEYEYRSNRDVDRWIIKKQAILGEIIDEKGHVHVNDFSNDVLKMEPFSILSINPLRESGLSPRYIDLYSPVFPQTPPSVEFYLNESDIKVSADNLEGEIDIVCYTKDWLRFLWRGGVYDIYYTIRDVTGKLVYTSEIQTIGSHNINDGDYNRLYSTECCSNGNHHNSYFGIIITNGINALCETCPYSVNDGVFNINTILEPNKEYLLRVYVDDVYKMGPHDNYTQVSIKTANY